MPEAKPATEDKKPNARQKNDVPQTPTIPTHPVAKPPKTPDAKEATEKEKTEKKTKAPAPKVVPAVDKKPHENTTAPDYKAEPSVGEKKTDDKAKSSDSKAISQSGVEKPENPTTAPNPKTVSSAENEKAKENAKVPDSQATPDTAPQQAEEKPKTSESKAVPTIMEKKPEDKPKAPEPKKADIHIVVNGTEKREIKIEPPKSIPADDTKDSPAKRPEQAAEGPKGIIITQVFEDRLTPPTDADLKSLPTPKEGEAFSMRLHPAYFFEFLEHPFTINRETKDYKDLYESIKENGIHDPVYVRPREKGGLEIMSGHRRHDIAAQLNYPIPTIIVHADDDTARIAVVDGNLHRMDIPTSELARAAKMKMEALSRKAGRRSKMDQLAAPQKRSDQQVAEDMGMSRNQVQRLVRIDSLVPELKQQVDDKKLPFNTAVELSYMKPEEQQKVVDFMAKEQVTPSMAQATELKEASKHAETLAKYTPSLAPAHKVDEKKIESIMKPKQEPELKITLKGSDLKPYFPGKLPPAQEIKQTIFDALGMHKRIQEKQAKKQEVTAPTR